MHSETHTCSYRFSDTTSNKVSSTNVTYIAAYMQDEEEHDVGPINSWFLKVMFEIQQIEEMEINTVLTQKQQIMS